MRVSDATGRASARRPRLYYRPEYLCDVRERGMRQTFDVLRAQHIHDALIACGAVRADEFIAPAMLNDADLSLVHTPEYLAALHNPGTLARLLFLDPAYPWSDQLLMPFLYAAGGTLLAAQDAAKDQGIGLNLGGGYHHAQADKAEGLLRHCGRCHRYTFLAWRAPRGAGIDR